MKKRFHSHKNGTAWESKKVRWFFGLSGGAWAVVKSVDGYLVPHVSNVKTTGTGLFEVDSWFSSFPMDGEEVIEVTKADLPYLEKPEGDWEFRNPQCGDTYRSYFNTADLCCRGETEMHLPVDSILQGYRWCKNRKEDFGIYDEPPDLGYRPTMNLKYFQNNGKGGIWRLAQSWENQADKTSPQRVWVWVASEDLS